MNMDGFREMLKTCSSRELSDLNYLITDIIANRNREIEEKARAVAKAWAEYKEKIKDSIHYDVKVTFKDYDKEGRLLGNDTAYTNIQTLFVNEKGQIRIELTPITTTERRFPK